ncbi:phospholipase A2 [Streptomyces sp. NPDC020951]|uniref:phospholipase A2 n=1 Tax=Streptomyces sp. NPDC020951 TaxID=3365104 RepID=UPI0037A48BC1
MTTRRRSLRASLVTVLACLTLWSGSGHGATAADVRAEADRIMNLNSADFARHPHVDPFDWSNDGCTWWPDGIFGPACAMHDFGYRNYGHHGRLNLSPTQTIKDWIDERFWHEMRNLCFVHHSEGSLGRSACLGEAKVMYDGLHEYHLADSAFF